MGVFSGDFDTDDQRWNAVARRDTAADGAFLYSVRTTGVYCRPSCGARLARRENVRFYATCAEAERDGFRPCKRCKPDQASPAQRNLSLVARVCRAIEQSGETPCLADLAAIAGMSSFHFHRVFKSLTGVTPKAFADAVRARRVREQLTTSATVTDAIYAAGFESSGRFYAASGRLLGMTPTAFRAGGCGAAIRFAVGECWLGSILVAATAQGVCAILLGDDPNRLVQDLEDRFPKAQLVGGDEEFEQLVARVVGFVSVPTREFDLPMDVRGTAFQKRVWEALRRIPPGSTATYAEIAQRIGQPAAARAVARACASNPLAIAIPCHRVVRTGGALSGYRWGVERKSAILRRESSGPDSSSLP